MPTDRLAGIVCRLPDPLYAACEKHVRAASAINQALQDGGYDGEEGSVPTLILARKLATLEAGVLTMKNSLEEKLDEVTAAPSPGIDSFDVGPEVPDIVGDESVPMSDRIVAVVQGYPEQGARKNDVVSVLNITGGTWTKLIKELVDEGRVRKEGNRRGARYYVDAS